MHWMKTAYVLRASILTCMTSTGARHQLANRNRNMKHASSGCCLPPPRKIYARELVRHARPLNNTRRRGKSHWVLGSAVPTREGADEVRPESPSLRTVMHLLVQWSDIEARNRVSSI
ncbi:hypothetical protein GQ53DRAFT_369962 [Thozetella sp. PMI_491]|nr:hypothetical protein GQ53DRAFT_369962 [Thozetella sp. PMI_491]